MPEIWGEKTFEGRVIFILIYVCFPDPSMKVEPPAFVRVLMLFSRGVTGGWAGWAIAHPGFGRIEGAARQQQRRT